MKILFTGGGTLGSVTPLLALWEECKKRGDTGFWIGTHDGPERQFVERTGLRFAAIHGGKLRRYFHWRNFFDPFLIAVGAVQSLFLILREKSDVVINAGSYIGVPVIAAASLLGKRCVVLQLDIEPSLSNLLASPYAAYIYASCEDAARIYPTKKTRVVGIPVQPASESAGIKTAAISRGQRPIVLVLGGGTGAQSLNALVWASLPLLTRHADIIHITGIGKEPPSGVRDPHYDARPLVDRAYMADLIARADCVVSRAGMGTIAELSEEGKATILVPLPKSHQEKNALWAVRNGAARMISQEQCTPESFANTLIRLLDNKDERRSLEQGMKKLLPHDAATRICELVHSPSSFFVKTQV